MKVVVDKRKGNRKQQNGFARRQQVLQWMMLHKKAWLKNGIKVHVKNVLMPLGEKGKDSDSLAKLALVVQIHPIVIAIPVNQGSNGLRLEDIMHIGVAPAKVLSPNFVRVSPKGACNNGAKCTHSLPSSPPHLPFSPPPLLWQWVRRPRFWWQVWAWQGPWQEGWHVGGGGGFGMTPWCRGGGVRGWPGGASVGRGCMLGGWWGVGMGGGPVSVPVAGEWPVGEGRCGSVVLRRGGHAGGAGGVRRASRAAGPRGGRMGGGERKAWWAQGCCIACMNCLWGCMARGICCCTGYC